MFKNLKSFLVYLVLRKVKAFTLELAKVVVLTLYLLQNKLYRTIKLFLLNSQLRSTFNILILYNLKEESSFRVPLFLSLYFLILYLLPKLQEPCPFVDSSLKSNPLHYN